MTETFLDYAGIRLGDRVSLVIGTKATVRRRW
jgi:hypothetical protein